MGPCQSGPDPSPGFRPTRATNEQRTKAKEKQLERGQAACGRRGFCRLRWWRRGHEGCDGPPAVRVMRTRAAVREEPARSATRYRINPGPRLERMSEPYGTRRPVSTQDLHFGMLTSAFHHKINEEQRTTSRPHKPAHRSEHRARLVNECKRSPVRLCARRRQLH